jgi:lysine 2,3-aminomutase
MHPTDTFPIGPETQSFRQRFYPETTTEKWSDWRWQLRHRLTTPGELGRMFDLSADESDALANFEGLLPVAITPYYASRMSLTDPTEALRRTHLPRTAESISSPGDLEDPLGEDGYEVAPGLVHRYPDRALFLVTASCSTYCRYCTRSRRVGATPETAARARWDQALDYIAEHTEVRDVLVSGGDPLTLAEPALEYLLSRLRRLEHVEYIRIGTKVPMVLPMRITQTLVDMLRRYHPLWMSLHVTHPWELTPETTEATGRLADAGIPLGSQTVLLKGVNDTVETIKELMHGLMKRRVRPYYLFQCDPVVGSGHFRTPISKGIEIIEGLRGHTSGYAVPTYAVDAPGGGGKIPLLPEYVVERGEGRIVLRNYQGKKFTYVEPPESPPAGATGPREPTIE